VYVDFCIRLIIPLVQFFFRFSDAPEKFKDAPIGIQVVGRTQQEEALIGMTEIVDRSLKAHQSKL
jgi:amidase